MTRSDEPYSREQLEAWDDAHVWHPFTPQSAYRDDNPLLVAEGDGNYLVTADGRRYLDGVGSLWCNLFGHRRKEIDAAISAQLKKIAHATLLGNASVPAVVLARRLVEIAPEGLTRVFFSDDGSTANEVALKISYQYWRQADGGRQKGRTKFLALTNAYHGDTVGAVSVGGMETFHTRFADLLFDVERAPSPYCYRCPLGKERTTCAVDCLAELERVVAEHGDELAAVVLEPGMQGAAGMIPYPDGFLRRAAEAVRKAGALLILDEVAMGMGRSGEMFVSAREGVTPDFLLIAKGITGGYLPLAATLTTDRIHEAFLGRPEEGRTFFHGHTYTGNALGAAAAIATLDIFEKDRVFDALPEKIERLRTRLETLRDLPAVGDIRQYGLAAGVEIVADRTLKTPFRASERMGMRVCNLAKERGVFLRPLSDVIVMMPPLSITLEEIDTLVAAIEHGIRGIGCR